LLSPDEFNTAVRSCRFCPMCRHADVTVDLTRSETYSARGRGAVLFSALQDQLPYDADLGDVLYRFFADGLCHEYCAGHIIHDEMVIEGRRRLVAAGASPRSVNAVCSNVERCGNPWGLEEPDLLSLSGATSRAELLVYFGATARLKRRSVVLGLSLLLRSSGVPFTVLRNEGDPGLLLYQLGHVDAGISAATQLRERIAQSGAKTVITPDADAYRSLKAGFDRVAPVTLQIRHSVDLLKDLAPNLRIRRDAPRSVGYHDPCALARFSPCHDSPRELIRALSGSAPSDVRVWNRNLAHCSGECGGVPFTHPDMTERAAQRRLSELRETGASMIVTSDPAAAVALQNSDLPVHELSEFAAACVFGERWEDEINSTM